MASQTPDDLVALEQMTVNLQIVSPSVGVNHPLQFPDTPASTTIKALKAMIRDALPLRPTDENQRLIYRGKALLRENESLLSVLGPESVRAPDQQTMHLVLRDVENPSVSTPAVSGNNTPANHQPPRPPSSFLDHLGSGLPRPPVPGGAMHAAPQVHPSTQPRMPSPAPLGQQLPPPAAAAFQQQHQQLTSWLNQVQRDAMTRAIVNQNQRGRAQAGMRGVADTAGASGARTSRESSSRRGSPAPTHTIYRESHGPNGHSYHVETVIRNLPAATSNGTHSLTDIHNLFRGADSSQGLSATGTAMQRTASGASLPNRYSPGLLNMASAPQQGSHPRQALDLYLLSSPDGPRGILINNSTMETFYTPRAATTTPASNPQRGSMTVRQFLLTPPDAAGYEDPFRDVIDEQRDYPRRRIFERANAHHNPAPAPAAAAPAPVPIQAQEVNPVVPQPMHAGNPMAGLGHFMVRAAPHLWNIARLGFFVWLFVGPNSSWTRWFVVIAMAAFVFLISTGVLNGMGDHFWRPIVRHLESLFPTLDRPQQQRRVPTYQAAGSDPSPVDMAARLVVEHNRRRPWISEQMRRLERAGLLFLASIAPGVAERHIANLEEEARREERRQQEAEAAAAAAAAEAERQATENQEQPQHGSGVPESGSSAAEVGAAQRDASNTVAENNGEQVAARERLVAL